MRAPPLHLAPGAELRINQQLQVVRSISTDGAVVLECPVRRTTLSYAFPELVAMRMAGTLKSVHGSAITHTVTGNPKREPLGPAMHDRVARRMVYGKAAALEYPVGPKSERMKRLIAEVAGRITDTSPPSAHSVYRWVRRYVTSGYNTAVFMQDAEVTRTRRPRKLTDEMTTKLRDHIQTLLAAHVGANLNGITNLALAKTAKDLGYIKFVTKEGSEELVDAFLQATESYQKVRASAVSGRTGATAPGA